MIRSLRCVLMLCSAIDLKHCSLFLKVIFCRAECELQDQNCRYMSNWGWSSWGVYKCVRAAWATDKVRRSSDNVFSFSSETMDDCPKQISNSRPSWSPWGAHRSDINKKSQLTTLFTGLMSLCEVSHLSGVKAVMASMCMCVCERGN